MTQGTAIRRRYSLHTQISVLVLALVLAVGGLLTAVSYKMSRDFIESSAEDLNQRISREINEDLRHLISRTEMTVSMLSHDRLSVAETLHARMDRLVMIREILDKAPALSAIYFGYGNGDFFLVRRIRAAADRELFGAPPDTRYIVQSIERGGNGDRGIYLYLGSTLEVLRQEDKPDYPAGYDPRARGWFNDAFSSGTVIRTPPYLFFSSRKVGITLAIRSRSGVGVAGADIELDTLGERLGQLKVTPGTQIAMIDAGGHLIAHENISRLTRSGAVSDASPALIPLRESGIPALSRLEVGMGGLESARAQLQTEGTNWRIAITPMLLGAGKPMWMISAIPDHELLLDARKMRSTVLLVTALVIVLVIPVVWLLARSVAQPLKDLAVEADAISKFDFSTSMTAGSVVKEVNQLSVAMEGMKLAIRRFLDISLVIAAEKDIERLLPVLLTEMMSAADADVAVLYLRDDGRLRPAAVHSIQGIDLTCDLLALVPGASGPLIDKALQSGKAQAASLQDDDIAAMCADDPFEAMHARHGLAVPLLNRQRALVGLMLIRRRTEIEDPQMAFVQTMSGLYASVLETRELIRERKELFDAFIQLIAGAVDAKSRYTGRHCERVPELTKMLAAAACAQTEGPFRDFRLDEEDWEAVHVASWLHDCGKVTTPVYVVDKATKLETLHDRIHEIRTRFEVLKRDAEIACLKAVAAGESEPEAVARLAAELNQLDDDFSFVAACNDGEASMGPENIERLKAIGRRKWVRTLDDSIGISYEEKSRKALAPARALPAVETLLNDKPEHRIERQPQDRIPEDNRWGFRMAVPELLYNKGEIHNLSVSGGTLTEEERYKINEHVVQTLIMLGKLPFPRHLRNVPEYAGGHHEKMDGSGYPKRLTREEMSPVSRIMAIADIFEALTAVDRPYKPGKKLSEALGIMAFMSRDKHIDHELFELFLRSGVYRTYAEKFMLPEQVDIVDIEQYLPNSL
jgi:HD-GYP domain-containing protein (c-di-GMP phosphodiesterase class II)/HAMP domain-containing protein